MPEVTIQIGGRGFEVSCQPGEESYLHSAAKMLDDEQKNNHHWSGVGGVSLQHLNELELYTLDLLNFTLLPIGVVGDMSCLESA